MGKLSFGGTGLSYQVNKVDLSNASGAPRCPRCDGRVYFNEEKKALGKSWHTGCFNCAKCKKSLDSTNANGHEGEVYCTMCHRREFGPKGYGFAGGAAGLSTNTSARDILYSRSRDRGSYASTTSSSSGGPTSPNIQGQQNSTVFDHNSNEAAKKPVTSLIDRDNMECCPRCGKRVYFAEEVKALKRKWHKLCFKCAHCNKSLDPGLCSSHESEIYCKPCYGRNFGPTGYGYGVGAGVLSSEQDPHRFYKPTTRSTYSNGGTLERPRPSSISSSSPSSLSPNSTTTSDPRYHTDQVFYSGPNRDYSGSYKQWTEHQEDLRYVKQIANELDQFEYSDL